VAGDKPRASWLNERQIKIITERAYMVMANQLGEKAWDMALVDTAGRMRNLYSIKGDYTIVSFWDVHCGKCKEDMPKLDTLYRTKWKGRKVNVYAVMVNESAVADWKPFIRKLSPAWVHVHQTDAMRKEEESAGKPNFRQLYDMRSTPTIFLLDSEMRIIAKNISVNDLDKLLQQKFSDKKPS
jgi:cytochrome oxidase Cu insertion factor (SCO1/SenC/PrrC family)